MLFSLLGLSSAPAQRQLFHEYGSSDGLNNLNVKCLLQDHTGYIWVGTDNGLFRYDGSKFRGFGHADGLPNTEILSLAESPAGVLWVGTNSGLAILSEDHFQPVGEVEQGATRYIGFDSAGDVYLQQEAGIMRGIPVKGTYSFRTVAGGPVTGLFVNGEDILFGKNGGLWSAKGDNARPFDASYGLPQDQWGSIAQDNLGNRWVRSRTRLYELPRGQAHFVDQSAGIPHAAEAHLYTDHHGSIFVSTISGIVVLAGPHRTYVDVRHGMPADPSGPMLIDREELLWMGTDGGGLVRRLGHMASGKPGSHRQLEEIAYCDMLTDMPNRRMFVEEFRKHLADRTQLEPFALLLIDLDFFKRVNDSFGHDAGDAVLIETASRLKAELRQSDCVARLGGDEFAILLYAGHEAETIEAVCRRILNNVSLPIRHKNMRLQVGCSIGIARFPFDGDSQESLYKAADTALYQAKQRSRNAFCWYQAELHKGEAKATGKPWLIPDADDAIVGFSATQ
jgi:diguanylate cyclase (GGDEF)-like protein